MTRRIEDLSLKRKPLVHPTPFVEYWSKHAPDALDLADEFGISDRQVRDLWQRAVLTKGAPLDQQQGEWEDYQEGLHGQARKASRQHRSAR